MSRKYIAREVLKRLQLGEPLGEELIRKFIRFLPELYEDSNGYDDFAKLRHDVFSAFRHDHADRLIGFDLGVCWGAISEEESVSLDYAQTITSLRVNNSKLREQGERLFDKMLELETENAKLRDSLKALMMGTNVELCADRDASQCQECYMALDEHRCAMSDAILLLGIDMYGEPLEAEVNA